MTAPHSLIPFIGGTIGALPEAMIIFPAVSILPPTETVFGSAKLAFPDISVNMENLMCRKAIVLSSVELPLSWFRLADQLI